MDIFLSSVLRLLFYVILFFPFMFDAVFWHSFRRIIIYNIIVGLLNLFHGFRTWFWWEKYLSYIMLYWILQYKQSRFMEDRFIWIRRECRLMHAVRDDISKASQVMDQIETMARQLLVSNDNHQELKVSLQGAHDTLVKVTEKVTEKSKPFISSFQGLRPNFFSRHLLFLQIMRVFSIWRSFLKEEDYETVKRFYESLEKSRSMLRCLQDITVDDEGESVSAAELQVLVGPITKSVSSIKQKISQEAQQEFWFKMRLLEGFLKDLEDVELESAIERAWIEEVRALMEDVDRAMKTFNQREEQKKKRLHRSFNLNCWFAEPLFSEDVKSLTKGLVELLDAKEKYGFHFIRRQKQGHPYDKDLKVLQNHIEALLTKICGTSEIATTKDAKDLKGMLEDMQGKLLKNIEVIEGASKFRCASLEQMSETIQKAQEDLGKYIEDKKRGSMAVLHTTPIKNAKDDIEKSMKAYSKVRRKSTPIIGFKEHTETLLSRLIDGNRYIHSVVGMQGIGKTTLAKKVYHHGAISNKFPLRRWVSVPEGCSDDNTFWEHVSRQVIKSNEPPVEEGRRKEDWVQNIHNFLKDKKYLIVLDNVSTAMVWNKLKDAFKERGDQDSRILLTTRKKLVALQADQSTHLELPLLNKEESWELFKEKMHLPPELLSQVETRRKAKEIVARCEGLPLTISCLGFQISGRNLNSLDFVSQELGHIVNLHKNLWSDHFQNIRNLLPEGLKNLVTYLTLFPRGFEIPVRRLIALWIAEDLVQKSADDEEFEQAADKCLSQLARFMLIQPVKKNVEGKLKTCRLPSALWDHVLQWQQPNDNRTYTTNLWGDLLSKISSWNQRPVHHHGRKDDNVKLIHCAGSFSSRDKEPLTFTSFDTRHGDEPGKDINNVLWRGIANGCFEELKVLDLEHVFRPHLPESIGHLIKLKYLGLRWTYLEKIPKSIGKLQSLQTLDVKHTYIRTLPSTIWCLENLRHLYLNQAYWSKFGRQTKRRSMQHLWTLWGVFLDEKNPLKDWLEELKNLRKLELAFQLNPKEQKELLNKVAKLKHLQTLRLRSIWRTRPPEFKGETQDLCLVDMSELSKLSSLYLFGKLNPVDKLPSLPQSLCDLTLSASGLQVDPMQVLKPLTNLRSLSLLSNSFTGDSMESSAESFPKLLVLKLWKLGGLKTWNIQEKAMESLKELEIRCCQNLEVPNGLKYLKTLRELKLRDMSVEFTETLILNKKPMWDNISNMPAITNS